MAHYSVWIMCWRMPILIYFLIKKTFKLENVSFSILFTLMPLSIVRLMKDTLKLFSVPVNRFIIDGFLKLIQLTICAKVDAFHDMRWLPQNLILHSIQALTYAALKFTFFTTDWYSKIGIFCSLHLNAEKVHIEPKRCKNSISECINISKCNWEEKKSQIASFSRAME